MAPEKAAIRKGQHGDHYKTLPHASGFAADRKKPVMMKFCFNSLQAGFDIWPPVPPVVLGAFLPLLTPRMPSLAFTE
jgi:hypothetical protein